MYTQTASLFVKADISGKTSPSLTLLRVSNKPLIQLNHSLEASEGGAGLIQGFYKDVYLVSKALQK